MEVTRYPLCWPAHQPRTPVFKRENSRFDYNRTREKAIQGLQEEVRRLGGRNLLISSNLKLRQDLLPYSSQPKTDDGGIAVYFDLDGEPTCLACDRFRKDVDNIWALVKTIESLRAIERYGSPQLMKQAFTGFAALPASTVVEEPWYVVLEVDVEAPFEVVEHAYRRLVKTAHPDAGGSDDAFVRVQQAWETFKGRQVLAA